MNETDKINIFLVKDLLELWKIWKKCIIEN